MKSAARLRAAAVPRSPRSLLLCGFYSASPAGQLDPRPDPAPGPDPRLVGALCRVGGCRNLPVPSLRFFLFAAALPGFTVHTPSGLASHSRRFACGARLFRFCALCYPISRDDAIRAFSAMEIGDVRFPTFLPRVADLHSLIFMLSHNGLLKVMQCSRGLAFDAATYGPFLCFACASKDARAVLQVLDRMLSLTPNILAYNVVIRLLCELGEIDEAYNILNEMASHGEKPNVWSYTTVLNTHCLLKEVNKALWIISRMDD
ncbi:hypothetical protein ACJX0J_031226, partial [Zea mays]